MKLKEPLHFMKRLFHVDTLGHSVCNSLISISRLIMCRPEVAVDKSSVQVSIAPSLSAVSLSEVQGQPRQCVAPGICGCGSLIAGATDIGTAAQWSKIVDVGDSAFGPCDIVYLYFACVLPVLFAGKVLLHVDFSSDATSLYASAVQSRCRKSLTAAPLWHDGTVRAKMCRVFQSL
jgi:hypothetical protein